MSVCALVCVYGCVPLHACEQRPEEAVASLKLELQVLVEPRAYYENVGI